MPLWTCELEGCEVQFNRFPSEVSKGIKRHCSQTHASKNQWGREGERYRKERREKAKPKKEVKIPIGWYFSDGYKWLTGMWEHPLHDSIGVVQEHRLILWNKLGCTSLNCEHECNWKITEMCPEILVWGGISGICVDHVDFDRSNNEPDNLVPSCTGCNTSRRPEGWISPMKGRLSLNRHRIMIYGKIYESKDEARKKLSISYERLIRDCILLS